jgi:hypothetical protein
MNKNCPHAGSAERVMLRCQFPVDPFAARRERDLFHDVSRSPGQWTVRESSCKSTESKTQRTDKGVADAQQDATTEILAMATCGRDP